MQYTERSQPQLDTKKCPNCRQPRFWRSYKRSGRIVGHWVCKPCFNIRKREWEAAHPLRVRVKDLKWRCRFYRITPTEFVAAFLGQEGKCRICGNKMIGKDLHIDHDHHTDKFRGLLCSRCNTGIGMFKHNPQLLRYAARYCAV
jgi:Recombination endonuclease VII